MLKWIVSTLFLLLFLSASAFSAKGDLFVVSSSGTGNDISITLCLNVNGQPPLSCQTYTTKSGTLNIRTTIPNKTYQFVGIKINSAGYSFSSPVLANGYSFIGVVSDTQAAVGTVSQNNSVSTTNPLSIAVDAGQVATFSTTASGGTPPYHYQWQLSTDSGTSFGDISAATASSYTTAALTTASNGYLYRVTVVDSVSSSVTSGAASLTVNGLLSATVTPASLSVDSGDAATFTINPAGGALPYHYQWYSCTTSSCTSVTAILNAISNTYSPSTTTTGAYYYLATVQDSALTPQTVSTNIVTLTVNGALSATVTPSSLSVDSGQTASFTANPVGGTAPYSYQWYACTDSTCVSPTIISGETSSTYSPSTSTTGTYYYQAVVTDSASSPQTTTTNVATLTINDALSAILSNPSSLSVYTNQTANFTANPTGGISPYSYQWYSCTDSTCASATIISGETSSTYSPSTATIGTYYYQAVVTDSASSPVTATTNVATLTVNSLPHIIFVTTDTYTGNLGGLSGANLKCNSDPGKPGGFALDYNYKALLGGNNATVSGTAYYRADGITLIATATGGNLVGLSPLTHSINASGSLTVWTGANGNSCSNWTSTATTGDRGAASSSTTQYWFAGTSTCSTARALYCVSQ